ncbi:unannotated protein [freshwater metagenome]|uniref:Unannotated protein n=1 Tax=freshwater metagenome TaxID=449393 RepID=A0A6J7J6K9_9ZZZZ
MSPVVVSIVAVFTTSSTVIGSPVWRRMHSRSILNVWTRSVVFRRSKSRLTGIGMLPVETTPGGRSYEATMPS